MNELLTYDVILHSYIIIVPNRGNVDRIRESDKSETELFA
jgi:hypothetical protein